MISEHILRRYMEFHETDMAARAHFTHFFEWMEAAQMDLFRKIKEDSIGEKDGKLFGYPKTIANCHYKAAVQFGDALEIHLLVGKLNERSIEYAFGFHTENPSGRNLAATGYLKVSYVEGLPQNGRACKLPKSLLGKIEPAEAEKLKPYLPAP